MSTIFGAIWGAWSLLLFTTQLIIVTPIYFVLHKTRSKHTVRWAHNVSRAWAWTFLVLTFIRLRIHNSKYIDTDKAHVFVANHRALLDIPVTVLATKNPFKYLGKSELKKVPLLGFIIQMIYIIVDRSSQEDRKRSLEEMNANIQDGTSILIYPEGTRLKGEGPLGKFYDGAFRLAIENQVPLGVMTLKDTRTLLPLNAFKLLPGTIELYWDEPIETKGMTMDDLSRLKDMAKDKMLSHLRD